MFNELTSKEKTLVVVGLGYVGLPIALEFAQKLRVDSISILGASGREYGGQSCRNREISNAESNFKYNYFSN